MFGRTPSLPVDVMLGNSSLCSPSIPLPEFIETTQTKMKDLFSATRQRLSLARARQRKVHDYHSHPTAFEIGDKVWLYTPAVPKGSTKKFASLWKGPYFVLDKPSDVNYQIQSITSQKQSVVHVNRLKLCHSCTDQYPCELDSYLPRTTDTDHGSVAVATSSS